MNKIIIFNIILVSLFSMAGNLPSWLFLPTYNHRTTGLQHEKPNHLAVGCSPTALAGGSDGLAQWPLEQQTELHWHPATFPHEDFTKLMPMKNVYGWYAHVFQIPPALANLDLLIDLGIIDDADETYLNGQLVGSTGKVPDGSAWQEDRLYRVSAKLLKAKENVLSVHVWSQWGLGGIVGPPVLKAALVPPETRWNITFIKDRHVPKTNLNQLKTAEAVLKLLFANQSPRWLSAPMPWKGYTEWDEDAHLALFRTSFDVPAALASTQVVLDLGPVFDVASVYLNNHQLGRVGRLPYPTSPHLHPARRAHFIVPPRLWQFDNSNDLLVMVYRERGTGGLPGLPGILLQNPLDYLGNHDFTNAADAFDILLQSEQRDEAEKLLSSISPSNSREQAWKLSQQACLAGLRWLDSGHKDRQQLKLALAPLAELLADVPATMPTQSAMQFLDHILRHAETDGNTRQEVQRFFPKFGEDCVALPLDCHTRGNWALNYGTRAYVLGAMGQTKDIYQGPQRPLDYKLSVPDGRDRPCLWLPRRQFNISHPDALVIPDGWQLLRSLIHSCPNLCVLPEDGTHFALNQGRISSWWDDHGEIHPFDDDGPNLLLILQPQSNTPIGLVPSRHFITFQHQDFDWRRTLHPRQQSLIILDDHKQLLNAVWNGKSDHGTYRTFLVKTSQKLNVYSLKHRSACVALGGFFIDSPANYSLYDASALTQAFAKLPITLKEQADELLASPSDSTRILLARQIIAERASLENSGEPVAACLLLALAADAAMQFEQPSKTFNQLLRSLNLKELNNLMEQVNSKGLFHKRWSYLIANQIFELIPTQSQKDKEQHLAAFSSHCTGFELRPLRQAALHYWNRFKLPRNSPGYNRLARSLPSFHGKITIQKGDNAIPPPQHNP